MILALVAVLVVLGSIIQREDTPSPLPTAALSTPQSTVTAQIEAVPTPVRVTLAVPTPTRIEIAGEVLAARRIEELGEDVDQIRELPKRQEIPLNFLTTEEMGTYLRRPLADSERRTWIEGQEALLAALDLSPEPGEAFPTTVQTRVRQLIAFYDRFEQQLFVSPTGRDMESPDSSLVHQYAHAYVDQHFDLLSFGQGAANGDQARARDALEEGDAMAVLAMHSYGGVDQADLDGLADHLSEVELTDYEGYLVSRAMMQVFVFPYREGTEFVAALLQVGWWPAVNSAYLDPPVSTEQILHPEKYTETPRDMPREVFLPDLSEDLGEGWRLVGRDVLGELLLRAHLDQYLPSSAEAHEAAAGWDGDLAMVWHDLDGQEIWVVRTLWDSRAEAAEFARSYFTVIDRRLRGARSVVRPILPRGARWWRGETGNAFLQQERDAVLIIWAPDTDTMESVLAVFAFAEE